MYRHSYPQKDRSATPEDDLPDRFDRFLEKHEEALGRHIGQGRNQESHGPAIAGIADTSIQPDMSAAGSGAADTSLRADSGDAFDLWLEEHEKALWQAGNCTLPQTNSEATMPGESWGMAVFSPFFAWAGWMLSWWLGAVSPAVHSTRREVDASPADGADLFEDFLARLEESMAPGSYHGHGRR